MNKTFDKKTIILLFSFSIILMCAAILTATTSFAMPKDSNITPIWNINFNDLKFKEKEDKKSYKINNSLIDFHVLLKNYKDSYAFTVELENNGTFDAYISRVSKTDLKEIKIGTSNQTGKTYYASDYLSFKTNYLENNRYNEIVVNSSINYKDKILSGTKNILSVNVKYKDIEKLSEDQKIVLDSYINSKENKSLELDLSLDIECQQLK